MKHLQFKSPKFLTFLENSNKDIQLNNYLNFSCLDLSLLSKNIDYTYPVSHINKEITENDVLKLWKFATKCNYQNLHISLGVRDTISSILSFSKKKNILLPNDIYQFYKYIVDYHQLNPYFYHTQSIEYMKFESLLKNDNSELLLITDPHPMNKIEYNYDHIINWLNKDEKRKIIVDGVYNYDSYNKYDKLVKTNKAIICFSLSKSWLMPMHFGISIVPKDLEYLTQNTNKPSIEQLKNAFWRISNYKNLPNEQTKLFSETWVKYGFSPHSKYLKTINKMPSELMPENKYVVPSEIYDFENRSVLSIIGLINETKLFFSKTRYHVTTLSNFVKGYDKYSRKYTKNSNINFTYPNEFHLTRLDNLHIGINKTNSLLQKLNITGDRHLIIETNITEDLFKKNETEFIKKNYISVSKLYYLNENSDLEEVVIENVYADSLSIQNNNIYEWNELSPRTISILPIAKGCQAKCPFCFSHSSISEDINQRLLKSDKVENILIKAKEKGATRAVITGGGEPTLLRFDKLLEMISLCSKYFDKTVLITNGYSLGNLNIDIMQKNLDSLNNAGLNVLSVSRHGYNSEINTKIMHLDTKSENISEGILKCKENNSKFNIKLRWVCVLQKGGVENKITLEKYLDWVVLETFSNQICFKELYVASQKESVYYNKEYNIWSYEHQIPMSVVYDWCIENNGELIDKLDWGSPIYKVLWKERYLYIAVYTEPSVYWEKTNKVCRSWNLMANGELYASLEDKKSILNI
jgi:uncharacterized Fe-S cluster-containing radical SAM superfamily protein